MADVTKIKYTPVRVKRENLFLKNEQVSRLVIGLLVFFIAFFALYHGGLILSASLLLLFWKANTEFINIIRARGINPSNKWIRFVSILFLITASLPGLGLSKTLPIKLFIFIFIFGVIGCFFRLIFRGNKKESIATIADVSSSVLGFVYTGLLPSFLLLLRDLGFAYAIIAIVSTAFCDIGAYYGGKLVGKTALKPEISAKKTFEGAIAGLISSVFVAVVLVYVMRDNFNSNLLHGLMIGLFCGIFSQFGDLFESLLKRDAGLKDSGKMLLSHGGILDRIDSYFFVMWAVYFYVSWVVLGQFTL